MPELTALSRIPWPVINTVLEFSALEGHGAEDGGLFTDSADAVVVEAGGDRGGDLGCGAAFGGFGGVGAGRGCWCYELDLGRGWDID